MLSDLEHNQRYYHICYTLLHTFPLLLVRQPLMLYWHVLTRCGAAVETRLPKDEVDSADNLLTKST